jgi:hypothetical protein
LYIKYFVSFDSKTDNKSFAQTRKIVMKGQIEKSFFHFHLLSNARLTLLPLPDTLLFSLLTPPTLKLTFVIVFFSLTTG